MMTFDAERVRWLYVDDLGQTYRTRALYGTVKQTDDEGRPLVGGRAPNDEREARTYPPLPKPALTPRTVTVVNLENGRRLTVVVYSTDAPLWLGTATTIEMGHYEPIPDDPHHIKPVRQMYQVRGRKDELYHRRRRRTNTTPSSPVPAAADVYDSTPEAMFAQAWTRTTKLELVPQHPVLGYRIDFAHLPTKTAIELDGYHYHSDEARFLRDRQRDRELTSAGWRVIRFAAKEVLGNVQTCVDEALRLIQAHSSRTGNPP